MGRLGCCAFPRQLASEDGPEGDEEGHEGIWQGLEQGRPRRGHLHGDRVEEEGLHEGHGQLGCCGHEAGEERGKGDHPWAVHDQDAREARDDRCEGLLRCRPEEEHLSLSSSLGALSLCWLTCCAEWESLGRHHLRESSCSGLVGIGCTEWSRR